MFSYVGGKSIHANWIIPELPDASNYDTYVEVFGGAFWVFIKQLYVNITDQQIVYNDGDPFMANDWFCIVNRREELMEMCQTLPAHHKETYDKIKAEVIDIEPDTVEMGDIDVALKHLYLIVQRFVVAGYALPRLTQGQKPKWDRFIQDLDRKASIIERIDEVENLDFQDVITKYDSPRTLFYVDPPYYSTEKYYHHEFPREDHLRLADCLRSMEGKFALSYYDFPELSEWFPEDQYDWHRQIARNMMGAKAGKKTESSDVECLIKNYSPNEALSETYRDLIEF